MKIEISRNGDLYLERHGKMENQFCPFSKTDKETESCGHWCPLFGEPKLGKIVELQICQNTIWQCNFSEFKDERGKP